MQVFVVTLQFRKQGLILSWAEEVILSGISSGNLLFFLQSLVHKLETTLNLETDTSEILNELIYTVRKAGRIGIVGVYAGYAKWVWWLRTSS